MPVIQIADDVYRRVAAFKQVVESVVEGEMDDTTCVEVILVLGLDQMLADLVGQDPAVLVRSLQKLAATHPDPVYDFVVRMMREGTLSRQQKETLRHRIGFRAEPAEAQPPRHREQEA
jgi:hypothetical protein